MATGNAAATLQRATDWATSMASASLVIKAGATTLATHTITSFTPSNNGNAGRATAAAIADETIAATGTANSAELTQGGKTYTLTVGTSGTDVIVSTTNYISGETSSVSSLIVDFPV